jgi:hypothetical protein
MNNLNIGDKVRVKSGKEEGFVVSFIDADTLEVEVEDGFRLPFKKGDLVPVSRDEDFFFGKAKIEAPEKKTFGIYAETGLFWAFVPYNDQLYDLYFVNNTDLKVALNASQDDGQICKGLICKVIDKRSTLKVSQFNLQNFQNWPALSTQVLYFYERTANPRPPLVNKIRFKADSFHKSKAKAPILDTLAHLFSLDSNLLLANQQPEAKVEPEKIKEAFFSPKETPSKTENPATKPTLTREIDLHIESLLKEPASLEKAQYLDFQIKTFEKELDKAIVEGCEEVIFIHGSGNGVLRAQIQKLLGKHPNVAYFQDAKKEKFGYGATMAKLK